MIGFILALCCIVMIVAACFGWTRTFWCTLLPAMLFLYVWILDAVL